MTPATPAAPHLREDLLTPRFCTTEIGKAARTDLSRERARRAVKSSQVAASHLSHRSVSETSRRPRPGVRM